MQRILTQQSNEMKIKTTFLIAILSIFSLSNCSVYMATQQPEKKDVSLFKKGTPRSILLGEFGYPIAQTEHKERMGRSGISGNLLKGMGGWAKAWRAVGYTADDVLTLGLWEVIGTPIESSANGNHVAYEVAYDTHGNVSDVVLLTEKSGK
ncbi:MAG: hypothetical protein ACR5LC_05610 [Symbiopectobacterium sp.]|uniref:hypothetical protein n=1 Tax=Symbiopectobacterium sp. TaxID=2952789 RepID=UPI003F2D53A8